MAYDKVVDSTVLNNNLTAVADAIREKAGVSGEFLFPSDFIAVINAIQAGGGGSDDSIDELISKEITEVMSNATKVGAYVFQECSSLTTADFPLATSIGFHAFFQCSKLTTVNFPKATSIGKYAFNECSSLETVKFPLVTSIGSYAFNECSSLETVKFPLVTSIEGYAFYDCPELTTADFPVATSVGSSAFAYCDNLTTVNFPLATSIGDYAFQKCLKLTTVNFPLATSIKNKMFDRCSSLTTADFSLVTSIGSYAFGDCYRLTTLILRSETMATLDNINAFNYCYHFHGTTNGNYNPTGAKDGYFYVPRALVDSYKVASNWSTFAATQFRALEDFTVDGTITGELDPNKI